MKIIKSIIVAFSMYSKIPMPRFEWDSEDMKYHLIFFPWVGAVIGCLEYLLLLVFEKYHIPQYAFGALAMVIPLVITGGFHVDGFMDTEDALSSWKTKEERLEILKDPHIGAFSVIHLAMIGLVLFASLCVMDEKGFAGWCFSFFIARALSGICVVKAKKAKADGLLHTEAKTAGENVVCFFLVVELLGCMAFEIIINPLCALLQGIVALVMTFVYLWGANKNFGGVTGDLAGWFVVVTEVVMAAAVGAGCVFL